MLCDVRHPNRRPPTFLQRINPLWWMGDAHRPASAGRIAWFLRNPFANFFAVIVGVSHRHRVVHYAKGPGWTYSTLGWNWGYTVPITGCMPRPFVSYRGHWVEIAAGWKTSGAFTPLQIRMANSKQVESA
jgi:hypothetical protein